MIDFDRAEHPGSPARQRERPDSSGSDAAQGSLTVTGVLLTDVQTLADATQVTSSGKVILGTTSPLPESANLLGLMSQALGTFAVGQGLPGFFAAKRVQNLVLDDADFDRGHVGWIRCGSTRPRKGVARPRELPGGFARRW